MGVKDAGQGQFEIVGLDADKELYGNFLAIDPANATWIETGVRLIGDEDVILAYRSAENLSDPPINIAKPNGFKPVKPPAGALKTLLGFKPVKPPAGAPELIGKPTPENPGSLDLKLGDPFGSPGAGQ